MGYRIYLASLSKKRLKYIKNVSSDKELFEKGKVSMEDIMPYSTKTVSTKTLKAYFLASHLKSTL